MRFLLALIKYLNELRDPLSLPFWMSALWGGGGRVVQPPVTLVLVMNKFLENSFQ